MLRGGSWDVKPEILRSAYRDRLDTGGRYAKLATAWEGQLFDEPWYVFNDFHGVVEMCGAERLDAAHDHALGCSLLPHLPA